MAHAHEESDDAIVEDYSEDAAQLDGGYGRAAALSMLSWFVGLVGITLLGLLGLRLVFQAGGANPTRFVEFVYDITSPLIQPFQGIVAARQMEGEGAFQPEIVIAAGVYLVAIAVVKVALNVLASMAAAGDTGPSVHHTRLARGH